MSEVVSVQFPEGGKQYYYLAPGPRLKVDTLCVVETEFGPALARVVKLNPPRADRKGLGPLRRVLRVATARDLEQRKHNERLERDAYRLCRQKVLEKKLAMKLVDVVYTLEGRKAIFFFTSENRVDFRELVKELAQALRVKIEMRQIGVRDEARRLGGVGACGRALCCCTFLKDFVSVSIRMAKDQNVSLNPTKVSGICGRLMCCLSYEHDPSKAKRKKGEGKPGAGSGEAQGVPACDGECAACANGAAQPPEENRSAEERPAVRNPNPRTGPVSGGRPNSGGRQPWNPHGPHSDSNRRRDQQPHANANRPGRRPEPQPGTRRPEPPRGPGRGGSEGAKSE